MHRLRTVLLLVVLVALVWTAFAHTVLGDGGPVPAGAAKHAPAVLTVR